MLVSFIGSNFAAAHPDNTVGHSGERAVVRDDNDGFAGLAAGFLQQSKHLLAGSVIQRAGGLVAQQQLGVFGQCAGDGYALLLTAGKLGGEVVQSVTEAHLCQGCGGIQRIAADLAGQLYVFQCGKVLHQVVKLKYKAHVIAAVLGQTLGVKGADFGAIQKDLAGGTVIYASQHVQNGGFAGAGSTHDDAELAALDGETYVIHCADGLFAHLVLFADIAELDKTHGNIPLFGANPGVAGEMTGLHFIIAREVFSSQGRFDRKARKTFKC